MLGKCGRRQMIMLFLVAYLFTHTLPFHAARPQLLVEGRLWCHRISFSEPRGLNHFN